MDGRERILVRIDNDNKKGFPIAGFRAESASLERSVEVAIREFVDRSELTRAEFLTCGFDRPYIIEASDPDGGAVFVEYAGQQTLVRPYLVKLAVTSELNLRSRSYAWIDKSDLIDCPDSADSPTTRSLISVLRRDWLEKQFGRTILNCVDILVFREKEEGKYEFLMLYRDNPSEDFKGWEYPKGGLEYHETLHEGAIRELLEETGLGSTGGFRYGGYLGYQTPDVSWRQKKGYDTLRVHGVTYLFYGRDEDIQMLRKDEGHSRHAWMPLTDAQEASYIGEYGRRFFDRWQASRLTILRTIARPISLVFQLTEDCPIGCRFCLRRLEDEKDATIEERREIIDILAQRGVLRLTFTGGEPTLPEHKDDMMKLIEYAHHKKIHTCLSTTGVNLTQRDIERLDTCLDQLLLSLHSSTDALAPMLYEHAQVGVHLRDKVAEILGWTKKTKIIVEVCTVVCQANATHLVELGEWLFSKKADIFWRLEEYYANGRQGATTRTEFELSEKAFALCVEQVEQVLAEQSKRRQIRPSTKEARAHAPDVMITPQGNLVSSSGNQYRLRGDRSDLLFIELKNRRPWAEYRDCIRTDWRW